MDIAYRDKKVVGGVLCIFVRRFIPDEVKDAMTTAA
jgi:hypothetical protein